MSKTTWKTIGYVALALVLIICLVVDGVFVYVKFFAPEKTVVDTFYFSTISTNSDESDDETYIIKVKYYSNYNGNGVEAMEIMFNNYSDESKSYITSYGIQVVMDENTKTQSMSFDGYTDKTSTPVYDYTESHWYWAWYHQDFYSVWCSVSATNAQYSYYYSDDQFETFTMGTSSTFADEGFVISLTGDEDNVYRLKFQGNVYANEDDHHSSSNYLYQENYNEKDTFFVSDAYVDRYISKDVFYFLYSLYGSLSNGTSLGMDSAQWIDFGALYDEYGYFTNNGIEDIFTFQVYSDGNWTDIDLNSSLASDKLSYIQNTFGGIYIQTVADGLSTASQSMFNAVNGSAQYNNGYGDTDDEGNTTDSEYGYTRQVVTCDLYDFEYIQVSDSYYSLKLSDSFIANYYSSRNSILLSVQIDLDVLNKKGITFYDFVDGTFDDFSIYECYTYTIVDGEKVVTEVNYA